MKRVGFLTSGGDCQALNATMRGVAKALYNEYGNDLELIGFEDGYKGLMYANYRFLNRSDAVSSFWGAVIFVRTRRFGYTGTPKRLPISSASTSAWLKPRARRLDG